MADPVAISRLRRWRADPLFWARDCIGIELDAWQQDALRMFPTSDGTARIKLKACAGPGKSVVLALGGWWFMTTQGETDIHPKGIALSITGDNLRDGLWTELAKWRQRSPWLMAAFEQTSERIVARDHPTTWFLAARSFARGADASVQGSSLSGLHSKYMCYLLDETGDMATSVGQKAEQGLAGATVGMVIQAGNPTSLSGLLAEQSPGYQTITITADPLDPKRTPRVPVKWAQEQIDAHGRDDNWVMAYILGQFPPGGINSLLGLEEVQTACRRGYQDGDYRDAARVIGVDVALQGDDSTVVIRRQGMMSWKGLEMRSRDPTELADRVALEINEWQPDMTFIDGTGGWGSGVISRLRLLGHKRVIDVQFAGKPSNPKFANKRAEMWWDMTQWVKRTGCLAASDRMVQDLITPTYHYNDAGKLLIESKEHIKKRGKPSPDYGDALCVTFANTVIPGQMAFARDLQRQAEQNTGRGKFDPLARVRHIR